MCLYTSILKIFIGGILWRDFFPSGITDCTKQIMDSNWPLCNESPINIILLFLKMSNNFKALNLKSRNTEQQSKPHCSNVTKVNDFFLTTMHCSLYYSRNMKYFSAYASEKLVGEEKKKFLSVKYILIS